MPRRRLGPRLYLDMTRRTWVIRDDQKFIRTGLAEHETEEAQQALASYQDAGWLTVGPGEHGYFIQARDKVKIGRAQNVQARFDTLQRMSPIKLRLLWAQPGGSEVEKNYHREFKECRVYGEWFEIRDRLKEFLGRYMSTAKMR